MKTLLLAILPLALCSWGRADVVRCSTWLRLPNDYVHGYCSNSSCNASIQASFLDVSGSCDSGNVTFKASTWMPSTYFSFNCYNGGFSGTLNGSFVSVDGNCSNGGRYRASFWTPSRYISGSCPMNGNISGYLYGQNVTVLGECVD